MEAGLKHAGVYHLFQAVVTSDDVRKSKPDPEGFLLAAGKYGVVGHVVPSCILTRVPYRTVVLSIVNIDCEEVHSTLSEVDAWLRTLQGKGPLQVMGS